MRERIAAAAGRSGRPADAVTLVAVTKSVGPDEVRILHDLGVRDFGENRVEKAGERMAALEGQPARWHMIGTVQRRKARDVAARFDWVHSIDRVEVGERLDRSAAEADRILEGFVQVNVSGEASKHGFCPETLPEALEALAKLPHLRIRGLMTMAPFVEDPEAARPVFASLRELAQRHGLAELSMGMTNDYAVAIEEGATHVRIGTALFKGGV